MRTNINSLTAEQRARLESNKVSINRFDEKGIFKFIDANSIRTENGMIIAFSDNTVVDMTPSTTISELNQIIDYIIHNPRVGKNIKWDDAYGDDVDEKFDSLKWDVTKAFNFIIRNWK